MLKFLTAGESHGKALVAILEGMVSNLSLSNEDVNIEMQRRKQGIGRSPRMSFEKDSVEILSGIRAGKTIGSPISILIKNVDSEDRHEIITRLRPGHADFAGAVKYNQKDIRNILERASARETASRVAIGAITKIFLKEFNIFFESSVIKLGGSTDESKWEEIVNIAREEGDSIGGIFEISIKGAPIGLGSYTQADKRLSSILSAAVMSIPAVKGVEIGSGFASADLRGSKMHDEIFFENGKVIRKTNNAGGIEGGISNGEEIVIRAAFKPIATMRKSLKSIDLDTKEQCEAHFERADVCAVHSAAVIGEAVCAYALANAFFEKFGGNSLEEVKAHYNSFHGII